MSNGNYVIVGGSRGIGLAMATQLSQSGNQVTVLSRTAGEIGSSDDIQHVDWDATSEDFPTDSLPDSIDGLVYCPGSLNLRSFKSLKPEVFREDFEVNVIGAIKAVQGSLSKLKAAESASILLFSTVAVAQGMFAHASIAASKGAVEGLARTLAAELAPTIRVNCLAPALTQTSLTQRFFSSEEKAAAMAEKYPMGRAGLPSDLAAMGCFLLSKESSWVTGQVIGVDGGMSSVRK